MLYNVNIMKFLYVSWSNFHQNIYKLAEQIKKTENDFDLIVAMARGGLSVAQILSDLLDLPIASFTIKSYKDLKQEKTPIVTFKLGNKLHGKKILLVDDVSDSGKTFIRGVEYLKELGAQNIKTASVIIKPVTKYVPDYYQKSASGWVIFPYEMKETIAILTKKGLSKKQLLSIGLPKYFVDRVK